MRRILVLIALVVIFALLFLFTRSVASWQHYVISGDPGTLLYTATFDGGSADGFNGDWTQYPGRLAAQITGGQMQITVGDADKSAYSVAAPHFGDFDLRVDAQTIDGPDDNGYGVVFRLQNKDNNQVADDSYYLFLISGNGYYAVKRAIDGQEKYLSTWIDSSIIGQGSNSVNLLRVVAHGDQFRFYINDQPVQLCIPDKPSGESTYSGGKCYGTMVDMLTDSTISEGQIGVAVDLEDTNSVNVVGGFDNVLIYAPAAS